MPNKKGVGTRINRIFNDNNTRMKIKTTQIQNRLTEHIFGKVEMSATQVTAALGLLRKTLPDLQAIELDLSPETAQRVINAQPMSPDEWKTEYSLESPGGTTESVN